MDPLASMAAVQLFNHLLARPTDHRHTKLLLQTVRFLQTLDARKHEWNRADVASLIHQDIRLAQELRGLEPPRPELAARLALRAAAALQLASISQPAYLRKQIVPELLNELKLTEKAAELRLPSDFWPEAVDHIQPAALMKKLDELVGTVDLVAAFPELKLDGSPPRIDAATLNTTLAGLSRMLPRLESSAKLPSPAELQKEIDQFLQREK
jgi:hypothetical protein